MYQLQHRYNANTTKINQSIEQIRANIDANTSEIEHLDTQHKALQYKIAKLSTDNDNDDDDDIQYIDGLVTPSPPRPTKQIQPKLTARHINQSTTALIDKKNKRIYETQSSEEDEVKTRPPHKKTPTNRMLTYPITTPPSPKTKKGINKLTSKIYNDIIKTLARKTTIPIFNGLSQDDKKNSIQISQDKAFNIFAKHPAQIDALQKKLATQQNNSSLYATHKGVHILITKP